jgi:HK97 family phage major capsid protein
MPDFHGNDVSGVIPEQFSATIIEEAAQQSAALTLGSRVPMGTGISHMPVPRAFPQAAFTSGPGARKPFTSLKVGQETLTAEEIAATVAIPDQWLEDASIPLWNWARPRLAEAIAIAFDAAVFFGTDAPSTYPAGGLVANATAIAPGRDPVDTVNNAMGAVEAQGLQVTGHAADLTVKSALRGVRDDTGALLLGFDQAGEGLRQSLYGLPISYQSFSERTPDYFTGAWRNLIVGVRSDIRYQLSTDGVIADDQGRVTISAYQDNVTLMKVWARFAVAILHPVTVRQPDGAVPFAVSAITGTGGNGGGDGGDGGDGRRAKAPAAPKA